MLYSDVIEKLRSECIGCGKCDNICPSFKHDGCSPSAIMLGNETDFNLCIGCGLCTEACDYTDPCKVMKYFACVGNRMSIPKTFEETGYHLKPSDGTGYPAPNFSENGRYVMPGCFVNSLLPFLEYATVSALASLGVGSRRLDAGCCLHPVPYQSLTDDERTSIKRSRIPKDAGGNIITICPGCWEELSDSDVPSEHIVGTLHGLIDKIESLPGVSLTVAIQPGCGLTNMVPEFRAVVEATGAEISEKPMGCCGKSVKGISTQLMNERQTEMKGVDAIIIACPSCFSKYDARENGIPVLHISELVALAAGDVTTLDFHKNKLRMG